MTQLTIVLLAFAIGLAAALVAWLLSSRLSEIPREDRTYKDTPPLGFRLLWWPIHWLSYYLGPRMSQGQRETVQLKLRQAGLEFNLNSAQYISSRLVSALAFMLLVLWVTSVLTGAVNSAPGPVSTSSNIASQGGISQTQAIALFAVFFGWLYPGIWLKDRIAARRKELLKSLPFYLDIITLCVEAGLNFQGAMQQAVLKGPAGPLRDEFQRVLRDIRAGKPRTEALRDMADRLSEGAVSNFVGAVIQAENMGMNLGPVLRLQADQRRVERFQRAEKLAMEAPVKMLFPLVAFIFPCTFIVLFFPIAMKFMHSGL
jgi:tight adherence protein C